MALTDKLTAIGNAIREKTGKMDLIPLSDMPNEILNISSGEENPIYYATTMQNLFSSVVFPENYEFVLKTKTALNMNAAFSNAQNIKSTKLVCDEKNQGSNCYQAFREISTLEIIDLTEHSGKITNAGYFALNATNLKSIYGAIDFSSCSNFSSWLSGASNLVDIEFVPNTIKKSIPVNWCSKLSKTSITSAINGLDNSVTEQTITFSKKAVNNAFGINVDDESTYTEEFNTLRNSKSNWTFAYA